MFNQWQISHFHLGQTKPNLRGAERTGDLMFVFIDRDRAVALDVQPHNSWTKQDLLRILLDTSPKDMENFELNAELGMAFTGTDEDLKALRKKGINSPVAIGGRIFVPGLGMTLSKHATRLVLFRDKIVSQIAQAVINLESDNCEPDALAALRKVNGKPRIGVSITAGEIFLYEKQNNLQIVRFPALA
jgi:hypothetical protein